MSKYWTLPIFCLFWIPWIFVSWWWRCDLYISLGSTFTALTCLAICIALLFIENIVVNGIYWLLNLLLWSCFSFTVYSHYNCNIVVFYTDIVYLSLVGIFLTFMAIGIILTIYICVNNRKITERIYALRP